MKCEPPSELQTSDPFIRNQRYPYPQAEVAPHIGFENLCNKVAIIAGAENDQCRTTAQAFAEKSADIVLLYQNKHEEIIRIQHDIENMGRSCLILRGDLNNEDFCKYSINTALNRFGRVDILVKYSADDLPKADDSEAAEDLIVRTYRSICGSGESVKNQ